MFLLNCDFIDIDYSLLSKMYVLAAWPCILIPIISVSNEISNLLFANKKSVFLFV